MKRNLLKWKIITGFLVTVFGFFGGGTIDAQTTTKKQVWEKEIHLPFVGSFTGSLSPWVIDAKLGIELAVEQLNNKGGINGRTIILDSYDVASDPALAVSQVKKAAPGALVVFGPPTSSDGAIGGPTAAKLKVPWFGGGTKALDYVPKPENRPWLWAQWLSNEKTGALIGKLLMPLLPGVKKVAVVQETKEASAVGQGAGALASMKERGLEIIVQVATTLGDVDFTAQATKCIAAKPDAIFISSYTNEAGGVIKELRKQGWKGIIITTQSPVTPELERVAGVENLEGVLCAMSYFANAPTPSVKAFTDAHKARYKGATPGGNAATNYDSMTVFADIFVKEKLTNDPAKLIQEREIITKAMNGKHWNGAYGTLSWDSNGVMSAQGFALEFKKNGVISIFEPRKR